MGPRAHAPALLGSICFVVQQDNCNGCEKNMLPGPVVKPPASPLKK